MKTWICLAFLGLSTVATVALAKPPKVALTPIDGDVSGDLGDAVADALEGGDGELAVIAPTKVTRAVDKLGYDGELTEKQARKVGTELSADAVVQGKLGKQGKSKVLHFTLFLHGKKSKGFTVSFSNAKSDKFKTMLREKMVSRIVPKGEADTEEASDEEAPTKTKKGGEATGDDEEDPLGGKGKGKKEKKSKKLAKSEASEDDAPAGDKSEKSEKPAKSDSADEGDEDDAPKRSKKKKRVAAADEDDVEEGSIHESGTLKAGGHAANRVAVRADVGVSFQNRQLSFTQRPGFTDGPKTYKNSPVPGARFEAEMYPLAFSKPKSFAAGLGLAVEYDKTLSLNLRTTTDTTTTLKAKQEHYSIGARLRVPFGSSPTSPTVTLGVGYAKRLFTFDRGALAMPMALDLPQTEYAMINPGLSLRIPLGTKVALIAGGEGWLIMNAGEIQRNTSYGQARVFGGSGRAGLDIILGDRFAVRLVGEFSQVGYSFTGKGVLSNNRDGDPMSTDIGGAADRSFGGAATLAVLY